MDLQIKEKFIELWNKYFNGAELPLVFYYADSPGAAEVVKPPSGHRCLICDLSSARKGKSLCFGADSLGCLGAKRYLGYSRELAPNFEYFLSCGILGKLEGERYKKSPELVREIIEKSPVSPAPSEYIVFKRWDRLQEEDSPEVAVFFAQPDVLSGLFTLANFDESDPNGVFAPFAAGCGTVVQYPYREKDSPRPRAVLGMFDVSARPCVDKDVLTFAVCFAKLVRMIGNMEESFLITPSWDKVRKRLARI